MTSLIDGGEEQMKIWKQAGKTHFQLKDLENNIMLIDFSIDENLEEEVINHMIDNLIKYVNK